MGLWRRSRRDDVDVESFLANLHRVADLATASGRRMIDLRPPHDEDELVVLDDSADAEAHAPARR